MGTISVANLPSLFGCPVTCKSPTGLYLKSEIILIPRHILSNGSSVEELQV